MAERAAQPANNEGTKFVTRIESVDKELETLKGKYMSECKALREDKKEILNEAKDAGFTKAAIKAVVKARELDRKAKEAYEDLDLADRDTFDSIRHALGDLAELPLGQAAVNAAGAEAEAVH